MSINSVPQVNFSQLAIYAKTLGDETRLRILWELLGGEKCVRDLASALDMTASAISHQLRELRMAGIVKNRREGKHIIYFYADERTRKQIVQFSVHILPAVNEPYMGQLDCR